MFLERWVRLAKVRKGQIPQLSNFAESVDSSKEQILNFFNYRITLGPLEGFNNLISRVICRVCHISPCDIFADILSGIIGHLQT